MFLACLRVACRLVEMSICDVIGDGLTRIRNGQLAKLPQVRVVYSGVMKEICNIMQGEGYVESCEGEQDVRHIRVVLRYSASGRPAIRSLKRISKPGCRVYADKGGAGAFQRGLGIKVLSTSRGVLPSYKAKELGVGGEVLCSIF
jgi:small subunit ribosomal protein S8